MVYVRQSTAYQVTNNLESQRRQYAFGRESAESGTGRLSAHVGVEDLVDQLPREIEAKTVQRTISRVMRDCGIVCDWADARHRIPSPSRQGEPEIVEKETEIVRPIFSPREPQWPSCKFDRKTVAPLRVRS